MCDQVRAGPLGERDCGGQEPDEGGGGAREGDVGAEERAPLGAADQRAPQGAGELLEVSHSHIALAQESGVKSYSRSRRNGWIL